MVLNKFTIHKFRKFLYGIYEFKEFVAIKIGPKIKKPAEKYCRPLE